MFGWLKKRKWVLFSLITVAMLLSVLGVSITHNPSGENNVVGSFFGGEWVITLGNPAYAAGDLDYTFDGVADDVQMQAALDALPVTGGRLVVVSATTINFTATVTRAIPNVTIEGTGLGTYFANDGGTALFTAGGNNWHFINLSTDYASGIGFGATTGGSLENVLNNADYNAYWSDDDITGDEWVIPSGRGATFIVAASDADAQSIAQADYVCDGTADDVQILAAQAALPASGGTILLTEGTFYIDTRMILTHSNLYIKGMGMQATVLESGITGATTGRVFDTSGTPDFIGISDLSINLNGNISAVNLASIDYLRFERVRMYNGDETSASTYFLATSCTRVIVRDCQLDDMNNVGIGGAGTSSMVIIEDNVITNMHDCGIIISYLSDIGIIQNNTIVNTGADGFGSGIDISRSPSVRCINNYVENNDAGVGIYAEMNVGGAPHDLIISGNTVKDIAGAIGSGIKVYGVTTNVERLIIDSNNINNTVGIGIWLETATNFVINDNAINSVHKAIKVDTATEGVISGNVITGTGANACIAIDENCTDVIVSDNEFDGTSTATNGIVESATGCDNNLIINNRIKATTGTEIVKNGTSTIVRGNLGYIAPGEIRTVSKAITAGVQNTVTSIQNTFGGDVLIIEAYVMISTADPDDAPTYDMGTDDDGAGAPSVGNNLFDAIPDTAAYYRSLSNGLGGDASGVQIQPVLWQAVGNDWVNFIIVDDDGDDTVGTIYITVMGK